MKKLSGLLAIMLGIGLVLHAGRCQAGVILLGSPTQIADPTTLDFNEYPADTVANALYEGLGITFCRPDAQDVYIYDWAALGRETVSPPNVLGTVSYGDTNTWATALNVLSATPLTALGAYVGNDQGSDDFQTEQLSIYGPAGQLLGMVQLAMNNNTSIDQFIGISSAVPFTEAQFENLDADGNQSTVYAVMIDDISFAAAAPAADPAPEPTTLVLLALGSFGLLLRVRRKLAYHKN